LIFKPTRVASFCNLWNINTDPRVTKNFNVT
jgi:hypothetical protein